MSIGLHAGSRQQPVDGIVPLKRIQKNSLIWTREYHTGHKMTPELWEMLDSGEYLEALMQDTYDSRP